MSLSLRAVHLELVAAITHACLAEGARVVIVSRVSPGVKEFLSELSSQNYSCHFIAAELAEPEQCRAAIAEVAERYGKLDALVNNAGFNDGVGLENGDANRFQKSLRQNLLHCYALAHHALPFLKQSRGTIVNIASKVALTGQGQTSGYAAAKGALLALTREWAGGTASIRHSRQCRCARRGHDACISSVACHFAEP